MAEGNRNYDSGYWAVVDGKVFWHRKKDGAEKRLANTKALIKKVLSCKKYDKPGALAYAQEMLSRKR